MDDRIAALANSSSSRAILPSMVLARLHDGREVEAKVTAIMDSPWRGERFTSYGLIALKIDPEQIIREVR